MVGITMTAGSRRGGRAIVLALAGALGACSKLGPADVGNRNPRSEFVDGPGAPSSKRVADEPPPTERVPAHPIAGGPAREIAKANARAIVTSSAGIYFGDDEDDALYVLSKSVLSCSKECEKPQRLARRAPASGALAIDQGGATIAWIANPGDLVLRIGSKDGVPTTVREHGLFTDVAVAGGDVFLTEARSGGGALTRVTPTSIDALGATDGSPRGIVVDAEYVFVASSKGLARSPRSHRDPTIPVAPKVLAKGASFGSPQADETFLYATTLDPNVRARRVVRVRKTGGDLETIATGVRDAPIALYEGVLYWFDAERSALVSADVASRASAIVSEDSRFERPSAITVDGDGVYVATGYGDGGRILVVPPRTRPR